MSISLDKWTNKYWCRNKEGIRKDRSIVQVTGMCDRTMVLPRRGDRKKIETSRKKNKSLAREAMGTRINSSGLHLDKGALASVAEDPGAGNENSSLPGLIILEQSCVGLILQIEQ